MTWVEIIVLVVRLVLPVLFSFFYGRKKATEESKLGGFYKTGYKVLGWNNRLGTVLTYVITCSVITITYTVALHFQSHSDSIGLITFIALSLGIGSLLALLTLFLINRCVQVIQRKFSSVRSHKK